MKIKVLVLIIALLTFTCKTAEQRRCEKLLTYEPLKINSYEELITYEKNKTSKIDKIVIDGKVANRDMIDYVIINNHIIEVKSIFGSDGKALDGHSKRVLIIVTNQCK
ncbi:hypothetical protein OAD62_04295 [Oceanihabitans sp.]|nr:hypothetical protein [Oceanihabitans sp.]